MADSLYPPSRPLSVGETLDLGFRIFRATLLTCLVYAGLAVLMSELATFYRLGNGRLAVPLWSEHDPLFWLLYAIGWLGGMILGSVIVLRQYAVLSGRRPSSGTEFTLVLRRLPELLLMWFLVTAATAVWFVPLLALRGANVLTQGLVVAILSIPASYVAILLSCAWPAFLLTGASALASLKRSQRLVRGSWWRIAAIYTIGLILVLVIYTIAGVIAVVVAIPFAHGDVAVAMAVSTVIAVLLASAGIPFLTALLLAVYGDVAARREGADLAQRIAAAG